MTGSLLGVASNAVSSSYALTASYADRSPSLQAVTTVGNTSTNPITVTTGTTRHSLGLDGKVVLGETSNNADGWYSLAQGAQNKTAANATAAHAEGYTTTAYAAFSHAEGMYSHTYGVGSHAEGYITRTFGTASHSEGNQTTTLDFFSHAEGTNTTAVSWGSHAEGANCQTIGVVSHAEGMTTTTKAPASHTAGHYTIATHAYQNVVGSYNDITSALYTSSFVVGVGLDNAYRKNGLVVARLDNDMVFNPKLLIQMQFLPGESALTDSAFPLGALYTSSTNFVKIKN
jgi:hypothetical protein